jgi:hypothetical protein
VWWKKAGSMYVVEIKVKAGSRYMYVVASSTRRRRLRRVTEGLQQEGKQTVCTRSRRLRRATERGKAGSRYVVGESRQ